MDRTSAANWVGIGGGRRGYRDRNLGAGLKGTALVAADRNAIQEELMKLIEDAGLTPDASDWTQLREACRILFGGGGTLSANGWQRLPGGLLVQWGSITAPNTGGTVSTVALTFPLAFPAACWSVAGSARSAANSSSGWFPAVAATSITQTGTTIAIDILGGDGLTTVINQAVPVSWMALGS